MAYITSGEIFSFLGITDPTAAQITKMEQIIPAAESIASSISNRVFELTTVFEEKTREIYAGNRLFLDKVPLNTMLFAAAGEDAPIKVNLDGASSMIYQHVDDTTTITVDGITSANTWSITDTLSGVTTWLNTIGNITAELSNTNYASHSAFSLYNQVEAVENISNFTIYPRIAIENILTVPESTNYSRLNIFQNCGYVKTRFVYTAGYTSVPSDIVYATILIAAASWNNSNRNYGLKSESLGDYSYTISDGSTTTYSPDVMNILANKYRNLVL